MRLKALLICTILLAITAPWAAALDEPELITVLRSPVRNSQFGYRMIPMGDQNGDGMSDLLVFSSSGTYIYLGGDPPDSLPAYTYDSSNASFFNLGDISDDGIDDILFFRFGSDRAMYIHHGGTPFDSTWNRIIEPDSLVPYRVMMVRALFDVNDTFLIVNDVAFSQITPRFFAYDMVDQDSNPDLAIPPINSDGNPLPSTGFIADNLTTGDFNGDGFSDIAVNYRNDIIPDFEGRALVYFGGPDFDSIPELVIPRPEPLVYGSDMFGFTQLISPGDLNQDGYDDLYLSSAVTNFDTVGFVFLGGDPMDSLPDLTIADRHSVSGHIGDINYDGYDDLITGYPLSLSGIGSVRIYYGGDPMDSIADIEFNNWEVPGVQTEFGKVVTGIGDFNGDSINDFAFSLAAQDNWGEVWIYSGIGVVTSIDDPEGALIPESPVLHQNYPNPFNPTTTISFELPRRSHATLEVLNVLGQTVATLADATLSAGAHTYEWDATEAASGTYLYRLTAGEFVETRKMVLVR